MPVRPTLQCWQEHGVTGTVAYCYLLIWIQGRTDALKSWWVVSYGPGFHRTQSILTSPSVCTRNDEIGFHRSPYASVYIYSWSLGSGEAQFLSLAKREQRVGLSIPWKRLLNQNQKIADPRGSVESPVWYANWQKPDSPPPHLIPLVEHLGDVNCGDRCRSGARWTKKGACFPWLQNIHILIFLALTRSWQSFRFAGLFI